MTIPMIVRVLVGVMKSCPVHIVMVTEFTLSPIALVRRWLLRISRHRSPQRPVSPLERLLYCASNV